ncbi:MAG: hypothetical protein K9L32_03535 [Chromatiaceae bacterium]|nr:hypothetical protein [Chromatiaceae bacterium]
MNGQDVGQLDEPTRKHPRQGLRAGRIVLAQSGQAIEIRNDARFQPSTW